ncbi:hypothetical protein SEA_CHUCKLY_72 [Mycobacterium phage Chuckly]|uniref:Uncharacterized protein n=1 Tax=Mycobacterium phage Chuckly TaxID=2656569 RepID=A0A649VF05_9CAUD|nr:hypothetical protein I5H22_gp072 [Mycobacterium phage Chuckly]QGJ90343.1 hypothetical protein SEA_CHUCKLY_72 [Mycobacterium phage Chuckly]
MRPLSERDAGAYATSMMLEHVLEQCHETHARTYVRTTHLGNEPYVGYRAQGGRTNFPQMVEISAFAPLGRQGNRALL